MVYPKPNNVLSSRNTKSCGEYIFGCGDLEVVTKHAKISQWINELWDDAV